MTRGTPRGRKFTEEHKQKLHGAQMASEAWWAGRRRASEKLKGRAPSPQSIAASLTVRRLKRLGQTRESAPALYEQYYNYYLERYLQRHRDGGSQSTS